MGLPHRAAAAVRLGGGPHRRPVQSRAGAAQRVGRAALEDSAWQHAARQRLQAAGIASAGTALYQWWPEPRAELFWRTMAENGIWVRLFTRGAGGIRCGLPPDEAGWRRLETALQAWKETG